MRILRLLLTALCLQAGTAGAVDLIQNPAAHPGVELGGDWRIIVDPYENGYYSYRYTERSDGYFLNERARAPGDLVEYDFSLSPTLAVPGDWNSQSDRLLFYEGTIWYQRGFALEKRPGKRYLLYFGAVNYTAVVYVNGQKAGSHEGGFTPFQFDITDLVRPGDNFVVVKVDNRREPDNVPAMNTDWWNYGGITRPVRLLEVGTPYLADYRVQLDPETDGWISGFLQAAGTPPPGDDSPASEEARIQLPELGVDRIVPLDASGHAEFRFPSHPEMWSPEAPRLYDVRITFDGMTVTDRIGFRRIAVEGPDILLNGRPVYLRGISIHEEAPDRAGRAWSREDARRTLTWAKELGCNFVRLAHYPHNEAIVRMADEMGLMVWSEIPVYWTIRFDDPDVYAKAEQQLEEMIRRDRNRAAIIMWSVANETPGTEARLDFLGRLIDRARALDGTRLLTAASDTQQETGGVRAIRDPLAEKLDVIGVNSYCGWYGGRPEECSSWRWQSAYARPVIISEFGAGALQGLRGDPGQRWTEDYQAEVYRHNLAMLDNMPFVRGTTPWILKDFRSPRRPLPGIQDFWNRKGLLSETGERKLGWFVLRDWYAEKSGAAPP